MSKKDIKFPELSLGSAPTEPAPSEAPPPEDKEPVVEVLKLRPDQWAVKKDLLSLHSTGRVNHRKPPYRFNLMRTIARWPDPNIDPHFLITEEEFTKVFDRTEKL